MTKTLNNLENSDPPVTVLDPDVPWEKTPIANPFLILKLHAHDEGNRLRYPIDNHPDFLHRTPHCVDWTKIEDDIVTLKISNLGIVASDLIKVNYQFVFCTDPSHGRDEGFIRDHSNEQTGCPDGFKLFSFLAPESELPYPIPITIPIKILKESKVKNLYFRARVSTFWEKSMEPINVLKDKAVVESTYKF